MLAALKMLAPAASAGDRYGKQKVVYHVNYTGGAKDKKYASAMRSIQSHIDAVGAKNMDIKVVLHGNGLGLLMSTKTKLHPARLGDQPENSEREFSYVRQYPEGAQDQPRKGPVRRV